MKKTILLLVSVSILTVLAVGQEVAEKELERYDDRAIEYVNYTGKHEFFNTAEEIRNIGRALSQAASEEGESVFAGKYTLRRIAPPEDGRAFGADMLTFRPEARVDHIDNVRRILDGYLMESFGYPLSEARKLSEAITLYNTHLQGRIDYFSERYTAEVAGMLREESIGLSKYYSEWAGATNILVPLTTADKAPALRPSETTETVPEERTMPGDRTEAEEETRRPDKTEAEEEERLSDRTEAGKEAATPEAETERPEERAERPEEEAEKPEARVAEEEVLRPAEELLPRPDEDTETAAPPVREKRAIRFLWFLGGGLFLVLLFLLLFLALRKRARDTGGSPYAAVASPARKGRGRAGLQQPLLMRVVYRGYLLSRKVFGEVLPGESKSVGGRGAYFPIPYGTFPRKIAVIENSQGTYTFVPVKPEFFPELNRPKKGFLEKEIHLEDQNGEKVVLFFHMYVSPLEKINQLLRSITKPRDEASG